MWAMRGIRRFSSCDTDNAPFARHERQVDHHAPRKTGWRYVFVSASLPKYIDMCRQPHSSRSVLDVVLVRYAAADGVVKAGPCVSATSLGRY
jgi:hypothetical protein